MGFPFQRAKMIENVKWVKQITKKRKRNKRLMGHIAHLRKHFKSINTFDYIITMIKRRKKTHYYLYENLLVLHLKKLESPSPKDALCQVWLKLAQWFWRRRFLNFVNVFLLFLNYLSLEKGWAVHLNKLFQNFLNSSN